MGAIFDTASERRCEGLLNEGGESGPFRRSPALYLHQEGIIKVKSGTHA